MGRVSSLYDSSYLKETLIKSDNDLISVSLKMHDKGGNARWRMGAEKCTMNVENHEHKKHHQILFMDESK